MCEICDIVTDKDKKGIIMVKKCFVLHKEVRDVFHKKNYIPTIEKLSFCIAHVRILGSMESDKTSNYFSMLIHQKRYKVLKGLCRKFGKATGIEIQSLHWG